MGNELQGDFIKFLGTGGARVVVSRQVRASAGAWLRLSGVNLYLDPGPGALVKCWKSRPPLDPSLLDGIIITHRHLDHAGDLNALTEAMTEAGFKKRGSVFLPSDALGEEPVLFRYLRPLVERLEVLEAGKSYKVKNLVFTTPVRHLHAVETYGLLLSLPWGRIAWIADTLYFPELIDYYRSDLLILNVPLLEPRAPGKIQHLFFGDACVLIREIRPKVAVLTHFGMTMLRARPWVLAERLSDETGVRVLAAQDGMTLSLPELLQLRTEK
ncbi:MAG TPA: MBL fold metallo-hydrolase [Syntrophomonadaceae bacterium]|nr:MBL fold metallo-hydrolase [Syntrophomonadaceae bacterium]